MPKYRSPIILFCLVLGLVSCSENNKTQHKIDFKKVKLENALPPLTPLGTFNPKYNIFPVVEKDSVIGLPTSLNKLTVRHTFIYRDQYFYWAFKNGLWGKKGFNNMSPPIIPERQTEKWVDCIVTIAYGKNSNNKWVVYIDKNNNENLSDDKPINFKTDTSGEEAIKKARININFEIYREGQIITLKEPFVLTYIPEKGIKSLGLKYDRYLRGKWAIKDQKFNVSLFGFGFTAQYRPTQFTYLLVDLNKDGKFDIMPGSIERYRTDQPFNILGITWKIDSIKADGTTLYLSKADTTVLPKISLRKGTVAPTFTAKTINGRTFELQDLNGKYVLLDFWGTWCGPCLEELPNLKKAHEIYAAKNLEIIGISVDASAAKVKKFVESHNIDWTQIFVEYGNTDGTVVDLYNITGLPTQYLIGPDGKIVAYGNSLRGKQLLKTLKSKL